jgi:hypothetical protein
MAKHDEAPELGDLSGEDLKRRLEQLSASDYFSYVESLKERVVGKKVIATSAGRSGFLLYLNDGSSVLSFLGDGKLNWRVGSGEPDAADLALMNAPNLGDGRNPLTVDLPYADEGCDLAAEIANAHGKPVTNLAIGENSYNFCFPEGRELEAMLVPDSEGRLALRVFWEQW